MRPAIREALSLLRAHQARSHFVDSAYGLKVSLVESYVLIHLDVDPTRSVTDLCSILSLDKNSVSRALERLEAEEFLTRTWSKQDKRTRRFELRRKARQFFTVHDAEVGAFLAEHLSRLSTGEIAELQAFQHRIGDAAGAAPVTLRKEEHPFMEGVRRVTLGLGFAGGSLFGSGHSSTVWQILGAIETSPAGKNLTLLSKLLGIVPSSLSQMVSRFEESGWVTRTRASGDGRVRELSLTALGRETFESIERRGAEILDRAMPADRDASRFTEILRKHLGAGTSGESFVMRERVEVGVASSDAERREARGFLAFNIVRLRRYLELPETIAGSSNTTYVLRSGAVLLAACEVEMPGSDPGPGRASNLAYSEGCSAQFLAEFLNFVAERASPENAGLLVKRSWIPADAVTRLFAVPADDDSIRIVPLRAAELVTAA